MYTYTQDKRTHEKGDVPSITLYYNAQPICLLQSAQEVRIFKREIKRIFDETCPPGSELRCDMGAFYQGMSEFIRRNYVMEIEA